MEEIKEIFYGKIRYNPKETLGNRAECPQHVEYEGSYQGVVKPIKVVIKIIRLSSCRPLSDINSFKKLGHSNIARIFDVKEDPIRGPIDYFIAIEMCDTNYKDFINNTQKATKNVRSILDSFNVVQQVLRGVEYLHKNKIYHGNLNIHNVLINRRMKRVKVSDYFFRSFSLNLVSLVL